MRIAYGHASFELNDLLNSLSMRILICIRVDRPLMYISIQKFTIITITKIIIFIMIMHKYLDNLDYCTALAAILRYYHEFTIPYSRFL